MNPRVSVAQRDAVLLALPDALAAQRNSGNPNDFASIIATAVVGAEDGTKTRYVIGVRNPTGSTEIYGTYPTHAAALKAIESGHVGTMQEARGGIFPLLAAPRADRKKPSAATK